MNKIKSVASLLFLLIIASSCSSDDISSPSEPVNELYFPPINSSEWATVSPNEINWNTDDLNDLYNYLEENDSRAFIVLKDGKIALEKYWGTTITGNSPFTESSTWYWASANKTIVSFLIGIAEQQGDLSIEEPSSFYLGESWTSMEAEKEDQITIRHHLSMSTGLDYEVADLNCTIPSCLQYKADAGTQWYYHNAPYLLLKDILTVATGTDYKTYTKEQLADKIGMNGDWVGNTIESVYWSSARDMARFGLLNLNNGKWDDEEILSTDYFEEMINTSQSMNQSYGYLWWLNGKNSIMYPGINTTFNQEFASSAPDDLFAGAGKNGQFVDIIPSMNLVVVRMGEAPDNSLVPIEFHNEFWERLMNVIE